MTRFKTGGLLWRRFALIAAVFACLVSASVLIAAPPAEEVEFSLMAEPSVGSLRDCAVLWGHGWVRPGKDRLNWVGKAPVSRYCAIPVGFRFVPESNGWAVVHIKDFSSGTGSKIEISKLVVTGAAGADDSASLSRNCYKKQENNLLLTVRSPSPSGRGLGVRVGEASGLKQKIQLLADVPVAVRFEARAIISKKHSEMPRIFSSVTPAHKAYRFFRRGVNFGNLLEAPPGENWGAVYDSSDYDAVKSEGFDHIRVPCAWHHHMGAAPDFKIDPDFLEKVSEIVTQTTARGLAVVVNWHHFDDLTSDPDSHKARFNAGWRQIASHYAGMPGGIAFELLNEPRDAASGAALNALYAGVIPVIRDVAPGNTIFVGPAGWNSAWELRNLRLPGLESNIIVTVHDYDPFLFTHQGASWTAPVTDTTGIVFPGPPSSPVSPATTYTGDKAWVMDWFEAYNTLPAEWNPCSVFAINKNLRLARAWSEYYGRPVRVGEWGCIAFAPDDSRRRYYAAKRRLLDESGLSWTIWDWKSYFRYWNPETGSPMPGLRQALFGE